MHFCFPSIVAAFSFFGVGVVWSQGLLDEATLMSLRSKPAAEVDAFAAEWVDAHVAAEGREGAAASLAELVAGNPDPGDAARVIRSFGGRIEPEFTESVLEHIAGTRDPAARGELLQLLRNSGSDHVPRIARLLTDKRPAEDLEERAKRLPKLRESIASGAVPFRVGDVAFNVIQEIAPDDKMPMPALTRLESIATRNERIGGVLDVYLPDSANPRGRASAAAGVVKKPTVIGAADSPGPGSMAGWSAGVIVALATAFCGLCGWWWMRRAK